MPTVCLPTLSQSLSQPTQFQVVFARIPNTVFYCSSVNLPGVDLTEVTQNTPFVDLHVPGDKVIFEPFSMTFLTDVQYNSWFDIQQWMIGLGFPEQFEQYVDMQKSAVNRNVAGSRPAYSDASLLIYTNKNNPAFRVDFKDCYPYALTGLELGYSKPVADAPMTATAKFRYSYFTMTRTT